MTQSLFLFSSHFCSSFLKLSVGGSSFAPVLCGCSRRVIIGDDCEITVLLFKMLLQKTFPRAAVSSPLPERRRLL